MSIYSPTTHDLSIASNTDAAPILYIIPILLSVGILWALELTDSIKARLPRKTPLDFCEENDLTDRTAL